MKKIKLNIKKSELALLGGKPVQAQPTVARDLISPEARRAANTAMKTELSKFLGRGGKRFYGGEHVLKLEEEAKKYFGTKYAVSFNSATTALQAAVAAVGVGPGDQVITSPFTMPATATAILLNGAVPTFADIDPDTYCVNAKSIEKQIKKNTRAILAVNIFGGTADYGPIKKLAKKHNLPIIEDNAQSPGATYQGKLAGTIGDIGILSFNVHKVIQSGEGGMLITNNKRYAYRAALVRNHGEAVMDDVWESEPNTRELIVGSNYRLTELQAAIMVEEFKRLDKLNNARIKQANYLTKKLEKISWLSGAHVLPKSKHVYYLYPLKVDEKKIGLHRDTIAKALAAEGFPVQIGYQKPIYLMPLFQEKRMYEHSRFPFISKEFRQKYDYRKGTCPVTERIYEHEIMVTKLCKPPHNKKSIDDFIAAVKKIEKERDNLEQYERRATLLS
ncbi:MAG: hypothetical protein COU08_02510 [Candidatus Harrisonbacteria bacterium CG10_big_fil_rev_8_21_14_0_10_42_17]|uniref:DegT/DnrJ/EryC1/StrS family aminotransferase n=1 Tax=Candidatus Harrisonbacteria bacterium CG10_big_fil_rev_8_21_14_0_10_42_17 TaxID=1974584 RepID=A0A2M6WI17_9BACT|nr:MAG: hypothetical protein COU08_02510 [Candidatus Harrisonbacteria bacterium CG10_big_fil_rev_8_21_14_0_10_42_17]